MRSGGSTSRPTWSASRSGASTLGKRKRDAAAFDLPQLVQASAAYTGAEIEKATRQALRRAFHEQREVRTEDLIAILQDAAPIANSHGPRFKAARESLNGLEQPTGLEPIMSGGGATVAFGRHVDLNLNETD